MSDTQTQHILIVDDDSDIRDLLGKFLGKYGYRVSLAANGVEMAQHLEKEIPDLLILDIMMPGDDGITICKRLRETSSMPIIMISAMADESDRIVGLEIGADDYIPKPFNPRELVARIKAVMRRFGDKDNKKAPATEKPAKQPYNALRFANWALIINRRSLVSPKGVEMPLSTGEYTLLMTFLSHPQQILSRDQLLDFTKNREAGPFDRSIDMQVSRLRQKLEKDAKKPELIKTIRGGGYLLSTEVEKIQWP